MNGLEETGYLVILGDERVPRHLMSANFLRDVTNAAHRHMQKYEIDLRSVTRDVMRRRAQR